MILNYYNTKIKHFEILKFNNSCLIGRKFSGFGGLVEFLLRFRLEIRQSAKISFSKV